MLTNNHIYNVQKFILNNKLHELHPIEAVQIWNGSFDLIVTEHPTKENGYKKKESLKFRIPTNLERSKASKLIDISLKRPLQVSDLFH